jgi:hypothetical protein
MPTSTIAIRLSALIALALGLLIAGIVGAGLVALGCAENVDRATARGDVCGAIGDFGGLRWWLLACGPAVVFLAGTLTTRGRDRRARLALATFVALIGLDALLLAVVTSNLLA